MQENMGHDMKEEEVIAVLSQRLPDCKVSIGCAGVLECS